MSHAHLPNAMKAIIVVDSSGADIAFYSLNKVRVFIALNPMPQQIIVDPSTKQYVLMKKIEYPRMFQLHMVS